VSSSSIHSEIAKPIPVPPPVITAVLLWFISITSSAKNLRNDIIYKPLYGTKQWAYQFSFAWKEENAAPAVKCLMEVLKEMYPR